MAYFPRHDKEAIVQCFLAANPGLVGAKTQRGFHRTMRAYGRSWQAAARAVSDEFFQEEDWNCAEGQQGEGDRECPICGAAIGFSRLPQHLAPECDTIAASRE